MPAVWRWHSPATAEDRRRRARFSLAAGHDAADIARVLGHDAFEESEHPRGAAGSSKGGQFVRKGEGGGGAGPESKSEPETGYPNPLGLSETETQSWGKRLAAMPIADALKVLDESKKAGVGHGADPADVEERLAPLRDAVKAAHPASYLFHEETDHSATPATVMAAQTPELRQKVAGAIHKIKASVPTDAPVSEGGHKNPDGTYTPEREALHRKILQDLFSPEAIAAARPAPGEKATFTILGGRGGSGKSWFTQEGGPVSDKAIKLDNDHIKSQLPEYEGWNAALVHEEASHIFNIADHMARTMGLNTVHDATMKTMANAEGFVGAYEKAGYQVEGYYMFLPPEVAAERAMKRFAGPTGRFVPVDYIMAARSNENTFDRMRGRFARWAVYSNNVPRGEKPRLVAKSNS